MNRFMQSRLTDLMDEALTRVGGFEGPFVVNRHLPAAPGDDVRVIAIEAMPLDGLPAFPASGNELLIRLVGLPSPIFVADWRDADGQLATFEGTTWEQLVDVVTSCLRVASGMDGSDHAGPERLAELTDRAATDAVAAFEPSTATLANLAQDGALGFDEAFVHHTIEAIRHWRLAGDADPRVLELNVAQIIKRLIDRLADAEAIRSEMLDLGADEDTADLITGMIVESLHAMTELGIADPTADASRLEAIEEFAQRTATAVEGVLAETKKPLRRQLPGQAAKGAATAAGGSVLTLAAQFVAGNWQRLGLQLLNAWQTVADIILRR